MPGPWWRRYAVTAATVAGAVVVTAVTIAVSLLDAVRHWPEEAIED